MKRGIEEGLQLSTQHVQKPGGRAPNMGNRDYNGSDLGLPAGSVRMGDPGWGKLPSC